MIIQKVINTGKDQDNMTEFSSMTKFFFSFFIIIILLFLLNSYSQNYSKHKINNNCMAPSLEQNDIVIVKRIKNPNNFKFKRGMLVVLKLPSNKKNYMCLRIVGFSGEEIEIKNGKLYINGEKIKEPNFLTNLNYIPEGVLSENKKIKVPEGYVFLLGDNSPYCLDSRQVGPIPITNIVGIVVSIKKIYYE